MDGFLRLLFGLYGLLLLAIGVALTLLSWAVVGGLLWGAGVLLGFIPPP